MQRSRRLCSIGRRVLPRILLWALGAALLVPATVLAVPTSNYYGDEGRVYDDWDVCRTHGDGSDGFLRYSGHSFEPVIATESLGSNARAAYLRGVHFAAEYPDPIARADAIFKYVRDNVRYLSDKSQFGYVEFAQNADEVYDEIVSNGVAYGDCEDYAVLLGVMYLGAGLRSAVVLAPDHLATLVYVPDFRLANQMLTVNGDRGWVWVEATGGNNPFGWMPERYMRTQLYAYELKDEGLAPSPPQDKPVVTLSRSTGPGFSLPVPPFFLIVGALWLVSAVGRRRTHF
jgi:hypothetical protein